MAATQYFDWEIDSGTEIDKDNVTEQSDTDTGDENVIIEVEGDSQQNGGHAPESLSETFQTNPLDTTLNITATEIDNSDAEDVAIAINLQSDVDRFTKILDLINNPDILHIVIEYCCDPESSFGRRAISNTLCIRLTEYTDMTTEVGLESLKAIIRACGKTFKQTTLWSAIPCTGGSTWQCLNAARGRGVGKGVQHRRTYRALWHNFTVAAETVADAGGVIAMDWPSSCAYWHDGRVQRFLKSMNMRRTTLDGCAYGMHTLDYMPTLQPQGPMMKPWKIASNSLQVMAALSMKCV